MTAVTLALYEVGLLGDLTPDVQRALEITLSDLIEPFGFTLGAEVFLRYGSDCKNRNLRVAFAAAFFGSSVIVGNGEAIALASELVESGAPVIPVTYGLDRFEDVIPPELANLNGIKLILNGGLETLASALLECIGLLRQQRRVFLSYKRSDSRDAAIQLHDRLEGAGFDAFLDTHDIRPADPFQDVLWHKLVDCDVLIMLDTKNFFTSKWTREELGKARAKEIHILRVVWPGHTSVRHAAFSDTVQLEAADIGPNKLLKKNVISEILNLTERTRSKSIAARGLSILGKFRAEVEMMGGKVLGVGAHRAISVELPSKREYLAYPIIGIPTAETLHDIELKTIRTGSGAKPVLIYDHVGIRDLWMHHLKWLDKNVTVVRAIKAREASWTLAELDARDD